MELLRRFAVPLVVLALAVAAAITIFAGGSSQRTLTAYFPRAISLYQGSDVRVLGVPVGTVDTVEPVGTQVKVVIHYDSDVQLPSNAQAVVVSPSIVGDRYVQITPAFTTGQTLPDNAVLQEDRTAVPLELDQIYSSLDQLTVALGPNGANKTGALSDLLEVTARNFGGQGAKFHTTIENFAKLTKTLDDNKEELFGSARSLSHFITKLADNDSTVRKFNTSLGKVSNVLAGERTALAKALDNLAVGLDQVGSFVKQNRQVLKKNITGLNRVAKTLVHQRTNLAETLKLAPLALNNLQLTYNPQAGTLDTNANIGNLVNQLSSPKDFLCALIASNDPDGSDCKLIQTLPLPRTAPFGEQTPVSHYGEQYDPTLGGLVGAVPAPSSTSPGSSAAAASRTVPTVTGGHR